jgi:flagellar FliL protein
MKQWLTSFLVLTLVAVAAGGLAGLQLMDAAERAAEAQRNAGTRPVASAFTANARLRRLNPVVTNLGEPASVWARVEASMVTDSLSEEEASLLGARIAEDVVAYLRSVSLPQLEGARGLQYLREDLNERAALRSGGKVRELIIETLVLQ